MIFRSAILELSHAYQQKYGWTDGWKELSGHSALLRTRLERNVRPQLRV
jgi:hypothetical protein